MAYMRLGDLLLSSGMISHEQLERALELQKESKERLGDVLVQSGIITEKQLIEALKIQLGVEFVDLTAVSIPVELAKYVPRTLAKKYCVVPVKLVRDTLYLAMSDPLDFIAQEEVKAASRKRVIPMIATHRATEQAISRLYGSEIDLRISSMPTVYGEKIVLRLLNKTSQLLSRDAIGLEGDDLESYQALLRNTGGVILLVGPTGSGKSTTMCVMLRDLAREEVNIVTLEDPVEYYIPGVSQCQINEKTGMTFAGGLRAILRQDPDIISVGEIRDGETASIAMRAAITGHLVLSTLHTNDAPSAVDRLRDVGVEPWLISGALRGVVSQRLVRRICPHCKRAYHPASDELALLGLDDAPDLVFYKGEGCPDCHHTGYTGRRAVFEILMIDAPLRRLITAGASADELADEARRHGFTTMRERCRDLVLRGETTAEEAARTISSTIES